MSIRGSGACFSDIFARATVKPASTRCDGHPVHHEVIHVELNTRSRNTA